MTGTANFILYSRDKHQMHKAITTLNMTSTVLHICGDCHTWMDSLLLPGVADKPSTRNLHFSSLNFLTANTTSLFPFARWHSSTTRQTIFLCGQIPALAVHFHKRHGFSDHEIDKIAANSWYTWPFHALPKHMSMQLTSAPAVQILVFDRLS